MRTLTLMEALILDNALNGRALFTNCERARDIFTNVCDCYLKAAEAQSQLQLDKFMCQDCSVSPAGMSALFVYYTMNAGPWYAD